MGLPRKKADDESRPPTDEPAATITGFIWIRPLDLSIRNTSSGKPARATRTSSPRIEGDPDRYIRRVGRELFRARPYLEGERYELGVFRTRGQAREAILEFWWGKRQQNAKFTERIRFKTGDKFRARIATKELVVFIGDYNTREEAAAAVRETLVSVMGKERAEEMLRRR